MLIHGPRGACVTRKDPETMRALCDFSEKPRGMYHCYCPKFQARKVRLGGTEPLALGASSEIQASPGKVPTAVRSQEKPISSHTPLWRACAGPRIPALAPGLGARPPVLSAPTTSACRCPLVTCGTASEGSWTQA